MVRLLIFSIFISLLVIPFIASKSLYKYKVIIDHMEIPKKDSLLDYGTVRVKKYNRTLGVVDGYGEILQPVTDDFTLHLDLFAEFGNDFQRILSTDFPKMCTYMKQSDLVLKRFLATTSLGPNISCPILPQRVYLNNSYLPIDRLPFEPMMTRGKVTFMVRDSDTVYTSATGYFILEKQTDIF